MKFNFFQSWFNVKLDTANCWELRLFDCMKARSSRGLLLFVSYVSFFFSAVDCTRPSTTPLVSKVMACWPASVDVIILELCYCYVFYSNSWHLLKVDFGSAELAEWSTKRIRIEQ